MEAVARRQLFVVAALAVPLVGCGKSAPEMHDVQGVVTYQGKPLPLGRVSFVSDSYRPSSSPIDATGHYSLKTIPGEHKIEVVANAYLPADKSKKSMDINLGEVKPLIPAKYNRYQSSGIVVKVETKPVNEIDIHLK